MSPKHTNILRVALFTPLRKLFDYLPPADNTIPLQPGLRVLVPFGKQKKVGVLVELAKETTIPMARLKAVESILDTTPIFPKSLLDLILWSSRYYQVALGEVFETALPSLLRKEAVLKPTRSRKKRVNETEEAVDLNHAKHKPPTATHILNPAQTQAVSAIDHALGAFQTFLVDGITGSGKTEIYLQVIQSVLNLKRQAMILVPEIGLTPQLVSRFQSRFQVPIAVLHSGLSDKKRLEAWEMARTGVASIVIGTRSALFTPLPSPGIFIIDEEHDPSFKQQEGFRYHARDLIILRAHLEKCPVVLGSATPSLETLHNAHTGRFQHLRLPTRAGEALPPTVQVLDIRHKKLDEGLSAELIAHMREHLNQNNQVLLFLNRRGFSPVMMCFECGFIAECKNCDARMTFHFRSNKLQCHHCDTGYLVPKTCPACTGTALKPLGFGTERLEKALQTHFPEHATLRLDRDTMRKKGTLQEAIQRIHEGSAHILLGTQMIAKGHHFPKVTLVAILDIDHALFSTDFRSIERMGQLITQVSGRAGREKKLGHVILQTCHPTHPLLNTLLDSGYTGLSEKILLERNMAQLPPYSYQALFRAEAKLSEHAHGFLHSVKTLIQQNQNALKNITVFGPIPAPMEKRVGQYRAHLLIQAKERPLLQQLLAHLVEKLEIKSPERKIRWSLDVDPIEMV